MCRAERKRIHASTVEPDLGHASAGRSSHEYVHVRIPVEQERVGLAMTILPPIAEAAQLAASITWLLSDDATNVSGVILPSDGGWSAI